MSTESIAAESADLVALLYIEQRALSITTPGALRFTITNETLALAAYRQSAFFVTTGTAKHRLTTASGLVNVAEDSPYSVWLSRFAQTFPLEAGCHRLDFIDAASDFSDGWQEWLPEHLLVAPLSGPDGRVVGMVMYARDHAWEDSEIDLLNRLHQTYGHCLWAMSEHRHGIAKALASATGSRLLRWLVPAIVLAMLIPVRLTALAPAEVVALEARAVAAPQDGVLSTFHVRPNAAVKAGDPLFSLDDAALSSRREVARQGLEIARADALTAQRRAFDDLKSRGELGAATGRVQEKEAELAAV